MRIIFLILCISSFVNLTFSQIQHPKFQVTTDIEIIKINDNAYVHVSYSYLKDWGRIASNGLIFLNKGKAILFDTPMTDSLTKDLVNWIQDTLKHEITLFVPNHWHSDCMGGLEYLQSIGIKCFANEMTIQHAKAHNLPLSANGFKDSITLYLGDKEIFCEFLGAAHSTDNIVVWIPSEKLLFAGCMAKSLNSSNLGNTADGDLKAYPKTIERVLNKYHDAKYVVPGHGQFGGIDLLKHTLELCSKNK